MKIIVMFTRELKHLFIAWYLSICFSVRALLSPTLFLGVFAASLATVGLGFVIHELAHKYIAMGFGILG